MRLEYLAPDALDRRDDLFRCDFREPSGTLIREAAAGAWTAPVVAVTVNGKTPIVVSGFRRIIAAGMAGIATVPVLIHDLPDTISSPIHDLHDAIPSQRNDLPSKDPARRDDASGTVRDSDEFGSSAGSSTGVGSHGVSVETRADAWAAALNAVHPAVHTPHEISGLAGRAARNLRLPVHRILNRMSLPDDPGFRTDIAAASVLSRNALKWCMRSGIDIRKTALTAPFPARERRLMIRLIRRTRMSLSRLRRFIQLLDDIVCREARPRYDVLRTIIRRTAECRDTETGAVGLLEAMHRARHPEFHRMDTAFRRLMALLELPPGMRVTAPPGFESDAVSIAFTAASLHDLATARDSMARHPDAWTELFQLMQTVTEPADSQNNPDARIPGANPAHTDPE